MRKVIDLHCARELGEAIDGVGGEERPDRLLDRGGLGAPWQALEERAHQVVVDVKRRAYAR